MIAYPYFSPAEFKRCNPPCDILDMDSEFMNLLSCARSDAGVPFVLNSAYRSSLWDIDRGRSGKGYHTIGCAVDIRCSDSASRAKIVNACLAYGLSCGISKTFIHVDNRPNQIVFLY